MSVNNRTKLKVKIQSQIKNKKNKHPWFSNKVKPHFDLPLTLKKAKKLVDNFNNGDNIHSFHPFIHFTMTSRKSEKIKETNNHKKIKTIYRNKNRDIYYTSHKDGYIYSFYAYLLSLKYENTLHNLNLSNNILAYRKNLNKNNIDFAKESFDEIDDKQNCITIAIDIKSFFDNIDHKHLKESWKNVLNTDLPKDHYKVFKSITKYSYVEKDDCITALNLNKNKLPFPICSNDQFNKVIKGLIKRNYKTYGIPQGSAISALLSNIYMLDFDVKISQYISEYGGSYRRYSDDILFIIPINDNDNIQNIITNILQTTNNKLYSIGNKLKISNKKTVISIFNNGLLDKTKYFNNIDSNSSEPLISQEIQYLGFTYDGVNRLIRSSTLSKYWQRVKKEIKVSISRAYINELKYNKPCKVKKEYIYEQFTHLGHKQNFINGYVKQSIRKMGDNSSIKQQIKNHFTKINNEFKKNLPKSKARRIRKRKNILENKK